MLHTNNPIIKQKAGLLNLAAALSYAPKACKVIGVSPDTLHYSQERVEEGGLDNLIIRNRSTPNVKSQVDEVTEIAVIHSACCRGTRSRATSH